MRPRLERIEHELGLSATQVDDPRHAARHRVVDGGHIAIHEQVMVSRSRTLVRGGGDLPTRGRPRDLHGPPERGPLGPRPDPPLSTASPPCPGGTGHGPPPPPPPA